MPRWSRPFCSSAYGWGGERTEEQKSFRRTEFMFFFLLLVAERGQKNKSFFIRTEFMFLCPHLSRTFCSSVFSCGGEKTEEQKSFIRTEFMFLCPTSRGRSVLLSIGCGGEKTEEQKFFQKNRIYVISAIARLCDRCNFVRGQHM